MENNQNNKQGKEFSLNLPEDVANGSYANLAIITHSTSEFIIDFAKILPGVPKPSVTNRIIMTPEHAKRLTRALLDNIEKFENQFGEIKLPEQKIVLPPMGFGPNTPNA